MKVRINDDDDDDDDNDDCFSFDLKIFKKDDVNYETDFKETK